MTWLLELLFDSLRTMCAQFVVDMMDMVTGVFTDLLSCDLSLFEELFSVAGSLYRNAILPMAVALLIVICAWQLLKTMFGGMGTAAEEPVELVGRSMLCLFLILNCKKLVDYLLNFAGTPYSWVVGSDVEIASFSGFVSASELAAAALGIDTLSLQLLLLIMQFVVAWNYFRLLFAVAERYVLLGIFSYTAPLAFASGGSKSTNNILANWSKMFGGQLVLIILDAWGLKMFLSAYGSLLASHHGFTRFFVGCLCLVGFCKIMQKLDSYLASLGLSLGRTSPGMSGTAFAVMAGRMLGRSGGAYRETVAGAGRVGSTQNVPDSRTENDTAGRKEAGRKDGAAAGGRYSGRGYAENIQDSGITEEVTGSIGGDESERQQGSGEIGRDGTQNLQEVGKAEEKNAAENDALEMDGSGIQAVYEEDSWMSPEEEAAAMETAIDMMRAEDSDMPGAAEGFDTGILFAGGEDAVSKEEHPLEDTYHPQIREAGGTGAGRNSGNDGIEADSSITSGKTIKGDRRLPAGAAAGESAVPGGMRTEESAVPGGIGTDVNRGSKEAESRAVSRSGKQRPGHNSRHETERQNQSGNVASGDNISAGSVSGRDGGTGQNKRGTGEGRNEGDARFVRNGKLYLAAERYEAPEIPYQMEKRNGADYYTVPESAASGSIKAVLQEDGSIRYSHDEKGGWEPKLRQDVGQAQGMQEAKRRETARQSVRQPDGVSGANPDTPLSADSDRVL